jgi:3-hydroxyacyl-CoA dehydrogenase
MLGPGAHVCVIGAGTMGSGIAAHLANLGFNVTLLDASQESVRGGFDRAKRARPPHFYVPQTADAIRLGSVQENLDWAMGADWICEAIVERLEPKQQLFARLDGLVKPDCYVTTNTSGLEIGRLVEGRSETFRRTFMGTHFFNPPRYLKLLELIPTDGTDPEAVREMSAFLERDVARRVVLAKDTPGFIANRYGMWSMIFTIEVAERLGLTVEEVDAICGPFLGRPRSAAFRLNDIVGIDVMADIHRNLVERCPHDKRAQSLTVPQSMQVLLDRGWIGQKVGQGYYRKEGHEFFSLDLNTHAYRMRQEPDLPNLVTLEKMPLGERVAAGLKDPSAVGRFLNAYLPTALQYANELKEEISHSVLDFDRVMQWGFGWEMGPFQLADAIGADKLGLPTEKNYVDGEIRSFAGAYIPRPAEPEYRTIQDFPVLEDGSCFAVRDLGDGDLAVSLRTKMGTVTPALLSELNAFLDRNNAPFVLTGESKVFSFGFDLRFFLQSIEQNDWPGVEVALTQFQNTCRRLMMTNCVSAVFGHCLGGGLELAGACPIVVAQAETQIGFPEMKVGLIPGGGGTVECRLRHQESPKQLADVLSHLAQGAVAGSADEAKRWGYLRAYDVTVYHPDRLMEAAKTALRHATVPPVADWRLVTGPLQGMLDQCLDKLKGNDFSSHDRKIGDAMAHVFAKPKSLEEAYERERQEFIKLLQDGMTQARIRHMLDTGKPLRN